jgi:signal transduction histidine kinase
MRSDGPLILAVLFLACGLTMIVAYGVGSAAFNAAYPFSAANLEFSIATKGPAAIGGLALTAVGALILVWALICAIIGALSGYGSVRREDRVERRADRFQRARLEQELKLEDTERRAIAQDRLTHEEDRVEVSVPKE